LGGHSIGIHPIGDILERTQIFYFPDPQNVGGMKRNWLARRNEGGQI